MRPKTSYSGVIVTKRLLHPGFYAPVNSTPTIPSYSDWLLGHSRPFRASSSHNIPKARIFYVPSKSTVKTLTICQHGRCNVSSTSRIAPPREGENVTDKESLREKARRMMREMDEALNLAKQARKRSDSSAEAMHKQHARALKREMERLNEEAAKAIFNRKNKRFPDGTVDLHGLRVKEALKYAKLEFQKVVSRGDKVVRFIVGKGMHAEDGKAKIRPAVEKLCKELGFKYHLGPNNNSGILVVQCRQ